MRDGPPASAQRALRPATKRYISVDALVDPHGPSMSRLGLTCCTRTVGPDVRPGLRKGTGLHTALGYSCPANLINNCHDEIRKASLVQLICPVRREQVILALRSGQPDGAMARRARDAQARARMLSAWRVRAGTTLGRRVIR